MGAAAAAAIVSLRHSRFNADLVYYQVCLCWQANVYNVDTECCLMSICCS